MNLYQEELTDHYRNPRNWGTVANPDFSSGMHNPSCGDSVLFEGRVVDRKIAQVAFQGKGCVISLAAASMLSQTALNKPVSALLALNKESMLSLIGMDLGPVRLKCALLPLEALQAGLTTLSGRE